MSDVTKQLLDATDPPIGKSMTIYAECNGCGHQWSVRGMPVWIKVCPQCEGVHPKKCSVDVVPDWWKGERLLPEHVPLTAAGSEDQAVYASIASNYHQPQA